MGPKKPLAIETWHAKLTPKRIAGGVGEIYIDFDWQSVVGHNQSRFSGASDLFASITEFAKQENCTPVTILSDHVDFLFDFIVEDSSYIAIVNIREFLKCTSPNSRSAPFFLKVLKALNLEGILSSELTPGSSNLRVAQLVAALQTELENASETLEDSLESVGPVLTAKLLNSTALVFNSSKGKQELSELIALFESNTLSFFEKVTVISKREIATKEFAAQLESGNWTEKDWQAFFERERWLFGHSLLYQFTNIHTREMYVGEKDMDNRGGQVTDFGVLTESKNARFMALVDIKTPCKQLVQKSPIRNNTHAIHDHMAEAVAQIQSNCESWTTEGSTQTKNAVRASKENWLTASPRGIIVIGHTATLDTEPKRRSFELFRKSLHNIEIITYDELLIKAEFLSKA